MRLFIGWSVGFAPERVQGGNQQGSAGREHTGMAAITIPCSVRHPLPDIRWLQHSVLDDLLALEQVLGSARHAR
jgi:hypothetical protein